VFVENKRLLKLFGCLDFKPVWGLLHEPYHDSGPGRPYYSPEAIFKALLLQRFLRIPSERVLPEKLAGNRDYRRICGFRRKTPSRGASHILGGNVSRKNCSRKPLTLWLVRP